MNEGEESDSLFWNVLNGKKSYDQVRFLIL